MVWMEISRLITVTDGENPGMYQFTGSISPIISGIWLMDIPTHEGFIVPTISDLRISVWV